MSGPNNMAECCVHDESFADNYNQNKTRVISVDTIDLPVDSVRKYRADEKIELSVRDMVKLDIDIGWWTGIGISRCLSIGPD